MRAVFNKPPNNLGLVGYWSFNDATSTKATDFSGNGNTGTFAGANGPTWVNGKLGKALDFEKDLDGYISAGTGADISALPFTISAWVNPENFDDYGSILSKRDTSAAGDSRFTFYLFVSGGNVRIDGGGNSFNTNYSPPLGQWTHLAVVATSTGTGLYVNGAFQTQFDFGTFTLGTDATAEVRMGNTPDGPDEYDGKLDEIRLYNRALGSTEVAALAKSGAVKFTTSSVNLQAGSTLANGLVGHWTFDGPDTQSTITDRSGQNNHGYFYGGATSSAKTIGKLGQALNFDNTDDYVNVGPNLALTGAMSACAWVKANTIQTVDEDYIIARDDNTDNSEYKLLAFSGGRIALWWGTNSEWWITAEVITTGAWYHVCATRVSGDEVHIYVDGSEQGVELWPKVGDGMNR